MTDAGTSPTRFINRTQLCKRFGISRQTEWRKRHSDPDWPRPAPFSKTFDLYAECEVEAYAQKLLAQRDGPPKVDSAALPERGVDLLQCKTCRKVFTKPPRGRPPLRCPACRGHKPREAER